MLGVAAIALPLRRMLQCNIFHGVIIEEQVQYLTLTGIKLQKLRE